MRILVDYRSALRQRTGVGEYVHELVRAYTALPEAAGDDVRLFTSSWKDRPAAPLATELQATVVDRRVPVRVLNYAWHRLGLPAVERLAGDADVVHALHPLLIPTRGAASIVTIHDLFFLDAPERTRAEIRRDYPALVRRHAPRADAVLTPSAYTAGRVARELGVARERIYVASPGVPRWTHDDTTRAGRSGSDGVVLFVGTLEPRKNVGTLLDAYRILVARGQTPPPLRLVGRATPEAAPWLEAIRQPPLATLVRHDGYVDPEAREQMYRGARMLVLPSLDEGFGLPALEAMSVGVPVIVSNRGALPEVVGDAGTLVDPLDAEGLAAAIRQLTDPDCARARSTRGLERARAFSWPGAAAIVRRMYAEAIARRTGRA